jgi:hypothetical protein
MENIICIELTKYNNQKLLEVSDILKLNYEALLKCKKIGDDKIWISPDGKLIAYTTKKNKSEIIFTDEHKNIFLKIKPLEKENKKELNIELEYDIDLILEKITSCGFNSLTKGEKEFLDKESKK